MKGFDEAVEIVFGHEGGRSNDPNDRGGLTLEGITQVTYDKWRRKEGLPTRPVTESTRKERREIYLEEYWLAGQCDHMPWPLSLVHFDSVVQHGRAPWLLQRALKEDFPELEVDGWIGKDTLAVARKGDPEETSEALLKVRLRYYAKLMTDEGRDDPEKVFAAGWIRRIVDLWDTVEEDREECES